MKYFIYCRKSQEAEDRQILSLESQSHEVARIIKEQSGIEIIDTFHEAFSAKRPGRPIFNEMLARIEKGEAQGIIAWHPDRLARNSVDGGVIMDMLDRKKLTDLKFANYSFENTSQGKFMLNIMFGQSKYYVDNLSENVIRSYRTKVEKQMYPFRPPNGYRHCKETKRILPDPKHFKMIRRIFEWVLYEKVSVAEIHRRLKEDWGYITPKHKSRGGKHLSRNGIHYILTNPLYAGYIKFNGNLTPGLHKPVVSKSEFKAVAKILHKPTFTRVNTQNFKYEKLFSCGACGKAITVERKRKPSGREYIYYHCTRIHTSPKCTQPSVEERQLTKELEDYFRNIYLTKEIVFVMLRVLQTIEIDHRGHAAAQSENINTNIKQLNRQLDTLIDLRVRNIIDDSELEKRRKELIIKRDVAREKLHNLEAPDEMFEPVQIALLACNRAIHWFQKADNDLKRQMVKILCSNRVLTDKKPFMNMAISTQQITDIGQVVSQLGGTSGVITVPYLSSSVKKTTSKNKCVEIINNIGKSVPKESAAQIKDLIQDLEPSVLEDLKDRNLVDR